MKKGFYFVLILCAACLMGSCSKTKSYTDMLNDEKKAISRLIDSLDIEVLKDFPDDSIFAENQFVKLDNGVYMNIIDRGEGRATLYSTKVMYRCEAYYFLNNFISVVEIFARTATERCLIRRMARRRCLSFMVRELLVISRTRSITM